MFLKISQNSQESTCARASVLIKLKTAGFACNFIKKETLAQVYSCEFCEIFKNNYFIEHVRTTAFAFRSIERFCLLEKGCFTTSLSRIATSFSNLKRKKLDFNVFLLDIVFKNTVHESSFRFKQHFLHQLYQAHRQFFTSNKEVLYKTPCL